MPEGSRRRPRLLGGVLAGALLASLPMTAAAEPSVARDVDEACSDAPTSAFSDRPPDGAGDAVDCVAHYRVTSGATTTAYAPSLTVTRGQMASLVVRTGEVAGVTLTEPATDPFRDDDGSVHERAIRRLASSGVATGFADGGFRPLAPVTRGQMASLLARKLRLITGAPLPGAATEHFTDDDGTTHEAAIDQLATIGVIAGRADGSFSPQDGVSREQMALFLARSLDWLTEDKGASLARIGVANPVEGPSLVSAAAGPTAPPSADGTATVAFTFDEEVAATIRPGDLALISFEASTTPASAATRDATNGAVVRATFPASALRLATTATVARGAVRDAGGNPSPEGAAPLQGIALLPGTTTGPDLFSLGRLGASTVDFNFDEAAFVVDPRGYHLVLGDGTTLDSTGAVGDGTTSHNVTFPTLTTAQSSQIVRGYVGAQTVSDAVQAPEGVRGDANPQQAVTVTAGGSLAGVPDLVSVAVDPAASQVRYTFDEAVDLVPPADRPAAPAPFRVYDLGGAEGSSGEAAVAPGDTRTVVVTFPAGAVGQLAAGASVDAPAVTSTATGATNRVDEEGLARTFLAGDTAAPDLVRAGRVQPDLSASRVVFEFDQRVAQPSATAFSVWSRAGVRTELSGCAVANDRFVECPVDARTDPALHAAVRGAVLAAIEPEAVRDVTGRFPSAADSDVL